MKPVLFLCFVLLEITAEQKCPTPTATPQHVSDPANKVAKAVPLCSDVTNPNVVHIAAGDCSKFWKCYKGHISLHSCPSGLHFNRVLQVCDWPESAGCKSRTESKTSTTTPQPVSGTDVTNGSSDVIDICSNETNPNALYVADRDCSKFWQCSNGKLYEHSCPSGLHFNRVSLVCDWPANAGCATPTDPSTLNPTTPTLKPVTDSYDINNSSDGVPICSDGTNSFYVANGDCTKFWQCYNGQLTEQSCPSGLHFNRVLQFCDWPENAGCETGTDRRTSQPSTSAPEPVTDSDDTNNSSGAAPICSEGTSAFYVANGDCRKFWQCYNGQLTEQDCPSGLHFNRVLQVCDWPENAGCAPAIEKTTSAPPSDAKEETGEPEFFTKEPISSDVTEVSSKDTVRPQPTSTITAPITTSTPEPTTITTTTTPAHTSVPTTTTTHEPSSTITSTTPLPTTTTPEPTTSATPAATTTAPTTTNTPESSTTTTPVPTTTTTEPTTSRTTNTAEPSTTTTSPTPRQKTTAPTTTTTAEPTTTPALTTTVLKTATTPQPTTTTKVAPSTTRATTEPTTTKVRARNIPVPDASDEKVEPKNHETSEEDEEEDIETICQKFDSIKLLPYPGDCRKFITCVRRQARVRECPSNQYFTRSKNACTSDKSACRNIILNRRRFL